jgi:hypothetical protein
MPEKVTKIPLYQRGDCFVATLLTMTAGRGEKYIEVTSLLKQGVGIGWEK